jgi:hypothetical protein
MNVCRDHTVSGIQKRLRWIATCIRRETDCRNYDGENMPRYSAVLQAPKHLIQLPQNQQYIQGIVRLEVIEET